MTKKVTKVDEGVTVESVEETNLEVIVEDVKKEFEKLLKNSKINVATVIFTVEGNAEPQLYRKGHFYDAATMINQVANAYRAKAAMDLGLGGYPGPEL